MILFIIKPKSLCLKGSFNRLKVYQILNLYAQVESKSIRLEKSPRCRARFFYSHF